MGIPAASFFFSKGSSRDNSGNSGGNSSSGYDTGICEETRGDERRGVDIIVAKEGDNGDRGEAVEEGTRTSGRKRFREEDEVWQSGGTEQEDNRSRKEEDETDTRKEGRGRGSHKKSHKSLKARHQRLKRRRLKSARATGKNPAGGESEASAQEMGEGGSVRREGSEVGEDNG